MITIMLTSTMSNGCSEQCSDYFELDHAKYNLLSVRQRRELIREIARWRKDAPKILLSWSRQELADLISAELGMERKYTGVSKSKLVERLLNLISENPGNRSNDSTGNAATKTLIGSKRKRTKDNPELLAHGHSDNYHLENHENRQQDILVCQNLVCRATLSPKSKFCKRCSCCICFSYDENKDPSLWLTCDSDSPNNQEDSCGMSCHLKCALRHERAGFAESGFCEKLDGSYYCVSCGKLNGIMGSWRKQLLVAKDARRVDVLCQRISLSHRILKGTKQYKELQDIVDTIVEKLDSEVGPIDQVSSEMARGLVSRLSCGAEVQQLCVSALEATELFLSEVRPRQISNEDRPSCNIRFEEVSPDSVVLVLEYGHKLLLDFLGCRVWHRKSTSVNYPGKPTYIVLRPQKRFVISDLDPSTKYSFKVSVFSSSQELGSWETTCITQAPTASVFSASDAKHENQQAKRGHNNSQKDSTNSSDEKLVFNDNQSKVRLLEDIGRFKEHHLPPHTSDGGPFTESISGPPATPCKSDGTQEVPSSSIKKTSAESSYEYCVRVIKGLERDGYMEKDFRVKFLTWFSLKSTMRDRRVVRAFVDNLMDDPSSLADQLADTFTDEISAKKRRTMVDFCTTTWH